ncbi:MAG: hypothetical protein QOJ53_41 [Sphingomonadales bacterium]|jgi:protein-S-isoprenylcysteine O-methyltransferase Ste14|nr:hypothetical protein [Sphingomonadales bacterium]
MTASDINQAEQASRLRASLMAAIAVILVLSAFLGFSDEASGATRTWVRHAGWATMILLWLVILATGGWLRLRKSVRNVLNDEVALANRSRALQAGFWVAAIGGLALYCASFQWDLSLRQGLRVLLDLTIATALLRYARLEMR